LKYILACDDTFEVNTCQNCYCGITGNPEIWPCRGSTCDDFVNNNWCTADNEEGPGWNPKYGNLHKYREFPKGINPLYCTGCGCKAAPGPLGPNDGGIN